MTTGKHIFAALAAGLTLSLAGPVLAGGFTQPNTTGSSPSAQSVSAGTAANAVSSVTSIAAAALSSVSSGGTARVEINGTVVTVSQDASGGIMVNGQPLVVNGMPNLGLLIALNYGAA